MIKITVEYLASQGLSPTFPERFWAKVRKTDSCWIWIACKGNDGYGRVSQWGKTGVWTYAHRASWILNVGPIPEGLSVLHKCPSGSNPSCVNPAHLYLGTQKENMADCVREGRHGGGARFGEENHMAKLDWDKVRLIRELYASGNWTQKALANVFGVWENAIWMIVHNLSWRQLNLPNDANDLAQCKSCQPAESAQNPC